MVTRLGAAIIVTLTAIAVSVGGPVGGATAQLTIPTLLPPAPNTPTTTAPGGQTPPTTNLVQSLLKQPAPPTTATPVTTAAPRPAPSGGTLPPGNAGGEGDAPSADAGPFPASLAAKMNSVRRSRPNSSDRLVDALKALTDLGVAPEEAMRVGMGRFPVAGRANFVDDWWFPRFGPGWRLHEGTDIFAARGTPLRAPAEGTVKFSDGGLGGIAVYVYQSDGTYFYMAHLDRRAPGLKPGQKVNVGDIVGFMGSTGNAAGGAPHLHFEIHPASRVVTVGRGKKATTKVVSAPVRPGTVLAAVDPKAFLDVYIQQALDQLPAIIASYKASLPVVAPPVQAPAVPESAVLAAHRLSGGGLIVADAPLVRTPLLGLAFLLIVMVAVLTPVLAPRRRLAVMTAAPAPAPEGAPDGAPKARGKAARKAAPAPPPVIDLTDASIPGATGNGHTNGNGNGNGTGKANGNGDAKRSRLRRRKDPAPHHAPPPLVGTIGRRP